VIRWRRTGGLLKGKSKKKSAAQSFEDFTVVAGTPCPSVDLLSCPPSAGNPVPAGMESRRGKVSPANSHYSLVRGKLFLQLHGNKFFHCTVSRFFTAW